VAEAVKHCKPVGAVGAGIGLLDAARVSGVALAAAGDGVVADHGVVTAAAENGAVPEEFVGRFLRAVASHRAWERDTAAVPA